MERIIDFTFPKRLMKNVYFIIVASFTFLLAGCGTRAVPAQQTPTPEVNSGVNIP